MASFIPGNVSMPPLSFEGNMATNWKRFQRSFSNFINAFFDTATDQKKVAMLLHAGGDDLQDIFESFALNDNQKNELDVVLKKFNEHFIPATNITYERFMFFNRKQQEGESYEQYMASLKNMAKTCEFGTLNDSLVRDIFVCGITDSKIQKDLLCASKLTMAKALEICRAKAIASSQIEEMKPDIKIEPVVDVVRKHKPQSKFIPKDQAGTSTHTQCKFCGYNHVYGKCPAYGKRCSKCSKRNHFASVCGSKEVNSLNETDYNSDEEFKIDIVNKSSKSNGTDGEWYMANLEYEGKTIKFKVDSGAQCNVISLCQYLKLGFNQKDLKQTRIIITSFSNNKIPILGKCRLVCKYKERLLEIEFLVVLMNCVNILGLKTSEQLGFIKRVDTTTVNKETFIPTRFSNLFDGKVGCIPEEVKIEIRNDVSPTISPLRRIPHALMTKVKGEIDRMEKMGIIRATIEPTDWVSQMVIVIKKDQSLRVCIDPRPLNKATKRAHYPFPTIEEISADLHGANYFCKLDAQSGYWMLPLDQESSKLCTFQTPWGRYSFLRLPFGLNTSAEIFHRTISETFRHINNVKVFQDDILVFADSEKRLREILEEVLQTAANKGIKFNPKKCEFNVRSINFLGHTFGPDGIKVDNEKVKAIKNLKVPTDKKSLQRLLGMFNYVSKFIPNYSHVCAPLRELLKDDIEFSFNEMHIKTLNTLKEALTKAPVLRYYNPKTNLTLSVDASCRGLGAVLLQEGKPIAYASRALSEVQMRYSQIEKELLAICFGTEKFRQYILGRDHVKVETDHKPLLGVFQKPLWKVPTRLQRMLLRIQIYNLNIVHTPGKYLYLADTLSRDFTPSSCDTETEFDDEIEMQIALLIQSLPVTEECWKLIAHETVNDPILNKISTYIEKGWPRYYKDVEEPLKPYFEFKDELSLVKTIILRGERILMPEKLRTQMLQKLHTGHPGITRMTNRAEMSMFWLGINQNIKKYVKSCSTCLKFQTNKIKLAMTYKKVPELPWMEVGCDIFELNQKHYLVVVDALSNYIEVASLKNLTSVTVIDKIKSIFARHGIPITFYSDGGLCFDSKLFKKFEAEWNFTHIMSSPHYPKSNGLAESAVKAIKKLLKKCEDSGQDPHLALLNLRNTPRGQVSSPAAGLMARNLRTNIPCTFEQLVPKIKYQQDRRVIATQKEKSKVTYDRTARQGSGFTLGDKIMFKKLPNSTWTKGTVVARRPTPNSYIVEGGGGRYCRNEVHIAPRMSHEEHDDAPSPNEECLQPNPPTSPLTTRTSCNTPNTPNTGQASPNSSQSMPITQNTPNLSTSPSTSQSNNCNYSTRRGRVVKPPKRFHDYEPI